MRKTMGNIRSDKESSLFHDGCCSDQAGFVTTPLFAIPEEPRLFRPLKDEVGFTLEMSLNKTTAYSNNARKTSPMHTTR